MEFDQIYLVNLPHQRGQLLNALKQLTETGIKPTVFSASDGFIPPLLGKYTTYANRAPGNLKYFKSFNKLEKNRNKHFIESAGAYGYINTYIRILEEAKSKKYKSILILEDDVILSYGFNEKFKDFFSRVPTTWKFISLGASQYNWDSVDEELAREQGFYTPKQLDTCGSFAIGIHHSIFDELIDLQSHYEAPFDHLPLGEIYNKYPKDCLVAFPNIVIPDVSSSSIRGSRNQLIHSKKMKWDLNLFKYPQERIIINLIVSSKHQLKYLDKFSEDNEVPFELHVFIPSLDGLRPYHNKAQSIETISEGAVYLSPNDGYSVRFLTHRPVTECDLIALYEALDSDNKTTSEFEIVETKEHEIIDGRVSIIIPTYKRSENIKDVVQSVVDQDYDNKEIIVVDDNSPEAEDQIKTKEVITDLIRSNKNTNIRYIQQSKNRNGSGARNTGFMHSTGQYICFLDDDDLYLPGRLSDSLKALKETPRHIGAVYCGFMGWNGGTNENSRYKKGNLTQELLSLDYLSHYLHTNTATYKREAVIMLNGFDETFQRHQDIEFNLRFFEYFEMEVVPQKLIHLRPKETKTNNQQSGVKLLETKNKFFDKFEYIINRLDSATKSQIYAKHWAEVVRYISNPSEFEKYILSKSENGYLQSYVHLEEMKKRVELEKTKSKNDSILSKTPHQNTDLKKTFKKIEREERPANLLPPLKRWQSIGVSIFGLAFDRFILPQQKRKLRDQPKAFFYDSKNSFTRFVGKVLRII